jgi:cold shock CspA family protein
MYIINCTTVSKWIFNRLKGFGFISEETCSRISFLTRDDLEDGELRKIIN